MSRRKLTPVAQRPLTAISKRGEMIKFGQQPAPPTPAIPVLSSVTISPSGTVTIGTSIRCSWTISSGYPFPTASYDWKVNAISAGAPDNRDFDTTGLNDGDVVTCAVTVTNSEGSAGPQDSSNSATMEAVPLNPPVNTVPPVISGNATVGNVLTVTDNGTWTNSPTGYTYQWRRNGVDITNETNSTYTTVDPTDVGTAIDCNVTASNADGSNTADSNDITVTAVPAGDRATALLANETDGLAIAFVDDSMLVKTDSGGTSTDILTGGVVPQSTTQLKIIRRSDGVLGFANHNCIRETNNVVAAAASWANYNGGVIDEGGNTNADLDAGVKVDCANDLAGVELGYVSGVEPNLQGQPGRVRLEVRSDTLTTFNLYFSNGLINTSTPISSDWTVVEGTFNPNWIPSPLYFRTAVGQAAGTFYFRRPQLIFDLADLTTGYIPNHYTDRTAAALPIDHDLSNNSLGVLNEPQATNLNTKSQDHANWGAVVGMTTSAIEGPDGISDSATRMTPSNVSEIKRMGDGLSFVTPTDGTTPVVQHAIVKDAQNGTQCFWVLRCQSGGNNVSTVFDLRLGVKTGQSSGTSQTIIDDGVIDLGNGWYKVWHAFTSIAGATFLDYSGLNELGTQTALTAFDGTGFTDIDIWHSHYGSGISLPTSPIIAAGQEITRDADWYSLITTSYAWWTNADTTYYAKANARAQGLGGMRILMGSVAAQQRERFLDYNDATGNYNVVDQGNVNFSIRPWADASQRKLAVAGTSGVANAITSEGGTNGASTGFTFSSSTNAPTINLHFGAWDGGNPLLGHITEIMWTKRLYTQTELNTLTTP